MKQTSKTDNLVVSAYEVVVLVLTINYFMFGVFTALYQTNELEHKTY